MFRISVIVACNNISCTYIIADARDDCSVPAVVAAVVPAAIAAVVPAVVAAVVPAATVVFSATQLLRYWGFGFFHRRILYV